MIFDVDNSLCELPDHWFHSPRRPSLGVVSAESLPNQQDYVYLVVKIENVTS
jgi:hypothetical protein